MFTVYHEVTKEIVPETWERIVDSFISLESYINEYGYDEYRVVEEYDAPNMPPDLSPNYVQFNGAGEDGHQAFVLSRCPDDYFSFTKTNRKGYTVTVMAFLLIVLENAPGCLELSCGDTYGTGRLESDLWKDARDLLADWSEFRSD